LPIKGSKLIQTIGASVCSMQPVCREGFFFSECHLCRVNSDVYVYIYTAASVYLYYRVIHFANYRSLHCHAPLMNWVVFYSRWQFAVWMWEQAMK